MPDTIRWGILGTGKIAGRFARGLARLPDAELLAVGSRTRASAEAFAAEHGVPRPYAGYDALVADAEVDVVYVATPHVLHRENSLAALAHGKAVLCEKPFTLNAAEAEEVVAAARAQGCFLMEALWTRFIPLVAHLRAMLADGAIGDVRLLAADFSFRAEVDPAHRLLDPALGGGALLDIGIYPLSLAAMLWGAPERITSMAHLGRTGVDEQAGLVLGYPAGRMAVLYTSLQVDSPVEADLMGTEGRIRLHRPMHHPDRLTLTRRDGTEEVVTRPVEGNGLHYQAAEVMRCLRAGRTESDILPLDETLAVMRTLDAVRAQWGLTYPGEQGRAQPSA